MYAALYPRGRIKTVGLETVGRSAFIFPYHLYFFPHIPVNDGGMGILDIRPPVLCGWNTFLALKA